MSIFKELSAGDVVTNKSATNIQAEEFLSYMSREVLEDLYWSQRLPLREVAKVCGCDMKTVKNWMRRFGIQTRNVSTARTGIHLSDAAKESRKNTLKANGFIPPNLGKKFTMDHRKKLSESHRGPGFSLGEHGEIGVNKRLRYCTEYASWRTAVFTRDSFRCVLCKDEGRLNADHIKPFSLILAKYGVRTLEEGLACKELWDVSNGRTLCLRCHKDTDTFAGKATKMRRMMAS